MRSQCAEMAVPIRACGRESVKCLAGFTLRVHNPGQVVQTADRDRSFLGNNWIDAPLTGEPEIEVTL